jgi:hypothetical protein
VARARRRQRYAELLAVLLLAVIPRRASAQLALASDSPASNQRDSPVRGGLATGAFLPYTTNASVQGYRAAAYAAGSHDGVRKGTVEMLRGEVVLLGRGKRASAVSLSVFGGGAYAAPDTRVAPGGSAYGGLKLQPLRQDRHGVDLAVAGGYTSSGFNLLPALFSELLIGRRFGSVSLIANATYGQSVVDADRFGSLRAAALVQILEPLYVGLDAKVSTDLERDQTEPEFEPQLEGQGAGFVSYAFATITFSARAGVRALRYRQQSDLRVGPEFGLSVATAL